jgi:hypothetical protein
MKTIIYAYTQNNQAYIGKTKNPVLRQAHHKERFKGWDYAVIDSIDSFDRNEWKPLETYWIEQFRQWGYNLLNQNKGGGGPQGWLTNKQKAERDKQYRLANKEKLVENRKQYNSANKEKIAEYCKQYHLANKARTKERYLANREKILEYYKQYNKQWVLNNKEKYNEYMKQYCKKYRLKNREKFNEYMRQRWRAKKNK